MIRPVDEPNVTRRMRSATRQHLFWFVEQCRAPKRRGVREFAEEEIVIPDGPYAGRKFRVDRVPTMGLLFEEIDSGRWQTVATVGPVQSGKSFCCFVIPTIHTLFELEETVVCGVPSLDIAYDKWKEDFEPVIERTRYRDLLPTRGPGSRGGRFSAAEFENGATLRFMTGGGTDKSRSYFTARTTVISEVDGMDEAGLTSRESSKVSQIQDRAKAYGARQRHYEECTASIEAGRIWQQYVTGSRSRIVLPCQHCGDWVSPEREHLVGWQEAEDKLEAMERAAFVCPECDKRWSEDDRTQSNLGARLVHRGQEITRKGRIKGDYPRTDVLGFRWSAVHNLLLSTADIAAEEYQASQEIDEDNATRRMRQKVWALPYVPPDTAVVPISEAGIMGRTIEIPRGVLPSSTQIVTVGVDVGRYLLHWTVLAWNADGSPHVVDYGVTEVPTRELGVEAALSIALDEIEDMCIGGWPRWDRGKSKISEEAGTTAAEQVLVDTRYRSEDVREFCRRAGNAIFKPSAGYGTGQFYAKRYPKRVRRGKEIVEVGPGYHLQRTKGSPVIVAHVNADHWKSYLHDRISTPMNATGGLSLPEATERNEHFKFAKHLTSEEGVEEFKPGAGRVIVWKAKRAANHHLDSSSLACIAGHIAGVRTQRERESAPDQVAWSEVRTDWFDRQRRARAKQRRRR